MSRSHGTRDFFVAGGALRPNAPSYVERSADGELLELIQASHFSYVLTSRQMGKTSLMHRTAQQLKKEDNLRTARIDLTSIGTASVEGWYLALLAELVRQLRLSVDLKAWWAAHAGLGAVTRFTNFVRDVLLSEIDAQVVIFIDEIDSTLRLDFSDEFFAAIRAFYNARAQEPRYERLTFVLLGVATPPDLIKDRTRTPFNIGTGLSLPDFTLPEAKKLQDGLEEARPNQGETIFRQIYQWTAGHPYLTQTLCQAVVKAEEEEWNAEKIDQLVEQLFFSKQGRKEENLQFVQDRILSHPQQRKLLGLYKKVYQGQEIADDAQSIAQNQLKLSGLVKAEEGILQVRNNIYRKVFDLAWVKAHTARDWTRIIAGSAIGLVIILLLLLGQSTYATVQEDHLASHFYKRTTSVPERITLLAKLFHLQGFVPPADYDYRAKELFYSLSPEEQIALFNHYDGPKEDLVEVINGLYTTFADVNEDNSSQPVLKTMQTALARGKHSEKSAQLEEEISHWLAGRRLFQPNSYNEAVAEYDQAIEINDSNPATLYERARVKAKLGQHDAALADLDAVMAIAQNLSVPANPTPTVLATATAPLLTPTSASPPTSTSTTTLADTPNNEPLTPSASATATNIVELMPITPIALPVSPTPRPLPALITAPFDTPDKMRSAVRALIEQEPNLLGVFINVPDDQYVNLQTISLLDSIAIAPTDDMVQVYIPAGDFEMGSADDDPDADDDEKPQHTVYLDGFWIDQTEITNAMFAQFVAKTAYQTDAEKEGWGFVWISNDWDQVDGANWQHPQGAESDIAGLDNHPVVQASWNDANAYCQWAGRRLPTEAEWEKAAGGTDGRRYPWGNEAPNGELVNFCDNNCEFAWKDSSINDGYQRTSPVGNYPAGASPYGALDMAGNVWEWASDNFDSNYYAYSPRENPTGPLPSSTKVLRGGSWYDSTPDFRVRNRSWSGASFRNDGIGFRCASSP